MQTNPYPIPSKTELVAGSQKSSKPKRKSDQIEKAVENIFFLIGMICVALVLLISIYLIAAGLPAIQKIGLIPFLTGTTWKPGAAVPEFGILPFILSSVYGMAGALIAGVPIGILAALYLAKGAKGKTKKSLKCSDSITCRNSIRCLWAGWNACNCSSCSQHLSFKRWSLSVFGYHRLKHHDFAHSDFNVTKCDRISAKSAGRRKPCLGGDF